MSGIINTKHRVLRTGSIRNLNLTETFLDFEGNITASADDQAVPAGHTITLTNLMVTNKVDVTYSFYTMYYPRGGTGQYYMHKTFILSQDTFVWSEPIHLVATDKFSLDVVEGSISGGEAGVYDIEYSYIDEF